MENLLQNGGFETDTLWIASSANATYCAEDARFIHSGSRCAKLVPTSSTGAAFRQENVMLQPGTSYLLTYWIHPVINSISTLIPASNCSISYVDEAGATKSIQESPRIIPIRGRYIQKRLFFTMPAGAAPYTCKVFVSALSHMASGDYICMDDVALYQVDGNDFPLYGYYAWVMNLSESLFSEAGGDRIVIQKNTNDAVIVYDQAVVEGISWLLVRETSGQVGWIRADRLGWTSPQLAAGKAYVTLAEERVWPRNQQMNRCAYYWPKDKRVLVQEHDATHYVTRYAGDIAYLEKCKCVSSSQAVEALLYARIPNLVESEIGRSNSRYFDNAQGNWSEAYAESIAMAAGVSRTELPCTSDLEKAVLYWISYPILSRFYLCLSTKKYSIGSPKSTAPSQHH